VDCYRLYAIHYRDRGTSSSSQPVPQQSYRYHCHDGRVTAHRAAGRLQLIKEVSIQALV